MPQVVLFDKHWFEESAVNQMTKEEAINVALHNYSKACIRSKGLVDRDKEKYPEKYSTIIVKDI